MDGVSMAAVELVLLAAPNDVESRYYTHDAFLGAFQSAFLDRIEFSVTPHMSARRTVRAVANLLRPEAHNATLMDALRRLCEHGAPVDPNTLSEHHVVAVFPVASAVVRLGA
jgi:hypothetical protein